MCWQSHLLTAFYVMRSSRVFSPHDRYFDHDMQSQSARQRSMVQPLWLYHRLTNYHRIPLCLIYGITLNFWSTWLNELCFNVSCCILIEQASDNRRVKSRRQQKTADADSWTALRWVDFNFWVNQKGMPNLNHPINKYD